MLSHLPGVTSVHSRFYDLSSKYYQTVGSHASYYKDALRFLGCVDIKDLPGGPVDAAAGGAGGSGSQEALGAAPRGLEAVVGAGRWWQLFPCCPPFAVGSGEMSPTAPPPPSVPGPVPALRPSENMLGPGE